MLGRILVFITSNSVVDRIQVAASAFNAIIGSFKYNISASFMEGS